MNQFITQMVLEKRRLEKQIEHAQQRLSLSPEGSLSVRKRKSRNSYYRITVMMKGNVKKKKQTNITLDPTLIQQLTEKVILKKILLRAQCNLIYLNKLLSKYLPTTQDEVVSTLGPQYQEYLQEKRQKYLDQAKHCAYPKAKFDERSHIHETDCGEFVRSKSEQIILNALSSHDEFITHYEEEFIYKERVDGINRVYPDFTIILPNGKRIIWEHLGRLDDPEYCRRTALKLCLYQRNGFVIGDNLILTMDDHNGNISSALILQAIQQILAKI